MLAYITSLFPQSKGEPIDVRSSRSIFEDLFPNDRSDPSPLTTLTMYDRVRMALSDADERLVRNIDSGKQPRALLPRKKNVYKVSGSHCQDPYLEVNEEVNSNLRRKQSGYRQLGINLYESQSLEAMFRGQTECLSHAMWILTGLLGLVRQEGFVPNDLPLFNQLTTSLSMSLAHQANLAASGISFFTLKRRLFFLDHLNKTLPDSQRNTLLKSSTVSASRLFDSDNLNRFLTLSSDSANAKQQQDLTRAVTSLIKSGNRSRSPPRSPRSSGFRSRSPSGGQQRSPKRVRFSSSSPPAKSPPSTPPFRK